MPCSYSTSMELGMAIIVSVLKEHAEFYAQQLYRCGGWKACSSCHALLAYSLFFFAPASSNNAPGTVVTCCFPAGWAARPPLSLTPRQLEGFLSVRERGRGRLFCCVAMVVERAGSVSESLHWREHPEGGSGEQERGLQCISI